MHKSQLVSEDMNFINCNKTVTRGHLLFKADFVGALCLSFLVERSLIGLVSEILHKNSCDLQWV